MYLIMATIDNKRFKKLLQESTIESFIMGEIEIYSESEEGFSFTYDVKNDTITSCGGIELSEGQIEQMSEAAYQKHKEEQPEDNNAFNGINHYEEYGVSQQMFI